jgi:hypothetical protein
MMAARTRLNVIHPPARLHPLAAPSRDELRQLVVRISAVAVADVESEDVVELVILDADRDVVIPGLDMVTPPV